MIFVINVFILIVYVDFMKMLVSVVIMISPEYTKDTDSTTIQFGNNYQFSIRCGKCADIHNAQLEGKTNSPCECACHNYPNYYPMTNPCPCPPYYVTCMCEGAKQ